MLIGSAPLLLLALPALSPRASLTAVTLTLLVVLVAPRWGRVVGRTQWAPIFLVTAGALVSLVGIWIHLSWLLLGPLSGLSWVLAAAAAPASRSRRFVSAAAAEVGFVAGALAGPYGPGAIGYSRDVADSSTGLLLEWISPFASGTAPRWALPAIAALAATAYGTVQLVRHRRDRGDHALTSAGLLAVAVPAALAGVTAIRFAGLALLVLVPLAGSWATSWADRIAQRASEQPPRGAMRSARVRFWADGSRWPNVVIAALVLLLPLALLASTRLSRPTSVVRLAEGLPRGCQLFSDPATASAVALVRPDVKVWIDGRADYWGRERNTLALQSLRDPGTAAPILARADCALLPTDKWAATVRAIDANSEWRRVDTADELSLWVRQPARP